MNSCEGNPHELVYKINESNSVSKTILKEYLSLYEIQGICSRWLNAIETHITSYLNCVDWQINKGKTLDYLKVIQKKYSVSFYRKKAYQIRKFLTYLGYDWAMQIKPPAEPDYFPKHITIDDIQDLLILFKNHPSYKMIEAIVMLGSTSGMRAMEMYQLVPKDIDIVNRTVHVNHNPKVGQTTKMARSRITFFTKEAQESLSEYIKSFNDKYKSIKLFDIRYLEDIFLKPSIKIKDLRKFFSQEWDRRGGPTSIKKILMGHSLKGDVDLMHYNYQSEEDLKKIYDKVMEKNNII